MQKGFLKIVLLSLTLFSGTFCEGQVSTHRLATADSLFTLKQYTQSLEHYESILKNGEFTYSMLLKMAYIHEGLGHMGQALYCLSLYEQLTGDVAAARKMEELATKNGLQGYGADDVRWLTQFYRRHHIYFSLSLASVCILLFALALRQWRNHARPVGFAIGISVLLIALFVHIQFGSELSRGIVAHGQTFMMAGPSPGADVLEILGEGNRLEIVGHTDVWTKVRWNGETGFIRRNNLLAVQL